MSTAPSPYLSTTPTLLIGLGGLGSSIVQSVHAGLPAAMRDHVRVHVLDTDVKEYKDERYATLRNERWLTQTSPDLTVMQCVDALGPGTDVRQWFPPVGFGALGHKLMTLGAAQVRAISRLALLDTMHSSRIAALNRSIDHLLAKRPGELKDPVRVNIVNSVAGGTGSGAFLQLALYVRAYLQQAGASNATVAAFVVMPEVFIRAGDYAADLQGNVKANGYAALKEIDALVRLRAGYFSQPGNAQLAPLYPVSLEYQPNSRRAVSVAEGEPPFDVVTLFDFTGADGSNLQNKYMVINQVEDAMRLHLFSPLEGRGGPSSQTDNLVNTHLKSGDRSRYAGCGTAHVVYPFEEVVEYAALRWASDGISAEWLELDRLVRDEVRHVEEARREGNYLDMPDPHTRWGQLLRDKGEARQPPPFYRDVYNDAHLLNEKGERQAPKHALWLAALQKLVTDTVETAVKEKEGLLAVVNQQQLEDPANTASQVMAIEEGLRHFAHEVGRRVQPIGAAIAKQVMWKPFDDGLPFVAADESQLNTWLLGRAQAMHQVAVRYFLVESRAELKLRVAALKSSVLALGQQIDGYDQQWDDKETDVVETAVDVATTVAKRPLARLRGLTRDFAEDYLSRSAGHQTRLRQRAVQQALLDCLELTLGYVDDFAELYRTWFLELDTLRQGYVAEVQRLELMHDQSPDRTRVYVHASQSVKRALWDAERARYAALAFPPDISREMYLALYRDKGRQYRQSLPPARGAAWVDGLFRGSVMGWCRDRLSESSAFDMDVSQAIVAELRVQQSLGLAAADDTAESALVRYLNQLQSLATPWVQAGGKGQGFSFLCLHPDAAAGWGDAVLNARLPRRNVHPGFSRHSLTRMELLYALCATDLLSMTGPHATYRSAYLDRVQAARAVPPKAITPHLDFRWDSPACLPELDDAEQAAALHDLHLAALLCLARQAAGEPSPVFAMQHDLRSVWHWSPHAGQQVPVPGIQGLAVPADAYHLVEVFAMHFGWVPSLVADERRRQTARRQQPVESLLVGKAAALLDLLAEVPGQAPTQAEGLQRQGRLLLALVQEVLAIHQLALGTPNAARQAALAALQAQLPGSQALAAQPGSDFAQRVQRTLHDVLAT